MKCQLLILSEDAVFARMLELEFQMWGLAVRVADRLDGTMEAQVTLIDLDSVLPPTLPQYGRMIGFTRSFSISAVDPDRSCSMILHRPFEMRLLREEVLALMPDRDEAGVDPIRIDLQGETLVFGTQSVSLTPNEKRIMACLLEHRGEVVPKSVLDEEIGASAANKTEVYVCFLRKKLESLAGKFRIRTVRGVGYRLDEN
ncbi:MAG: response regulator transcription factor [Clostridia bacterium]|nr:response regulator transcription factor [Clostridia bacterium]